MARALPPAQIVRKFFDEAFDRQAPVWALRWDEAPGEADRLWELPEGLCVVGPPPRRFGIHLKRHGADGYAVRLQWDRSLLSWPALTRVELLGSCLAALLAAVGSDLWAMLDQPLPAARGWLRAA
jgi:hypothetical protein